MAWSYCVGLRVKPGMTERSAYPIFDFYQNLYTFAAKVNILYIY